MDILITFDDGTTELRPANSPAMFDGGHDCSTRWPEYSPADVIAVEQGEYDAPERRMVAIFKPGTKLGIYLGTLQDRELQKQGKEWRGTYCEELRKFQDWKSKHDKRVTPLVWTEQWGWRPCKVETVEEQFARITRERDTALRERDAARAAARAWKGLARRYLRIFRAVRKTWELNSSGGVDQ